MVKHSLLALTEFSWTQWNRYNSRLTEFSVRGVFITWVDIDEIRNCSRKQWKQFSTVEWKLVEVLNHNARLHRLFSPLSWKWWFLGVWYFYYRASSFCSLSRMRASQWKTHSCVMCSTFHYTKLMTSNENFLRVSDLLQLTYAPIPSIRWKPTSFSFNITPLLKFQS